MTNHGFPAAAQAAAERQARQQGEKVAPQQTSFNQAREPQPCVVDVPALIEAAKRPFADRTLATIVEKAKHGFPHERR